MLTQLGCFASVCCEIAIRAHAFRIVLTFRVITDVIPLFFSFLLTNLFIRILNDWYLRPRIIVLDLLLFWLTWRWLCKHDLFHPTYLWVFVASLGKFSHIILFDEIPIIGEIKPYIFKIFFLLHSQVTLALPRAHLILFDHLRLIPLSGENFFHL